jgi:hypothetical protein
LIEEDSAKSPKMPFKLRIAAGLVILLWLAYTALQTLFVMQHLSEALAAILGLIPGILGVSALLVAGLVPGDCHLRMAPLSGTGLAVLAAVFFFALAAILPFGAWTGLDCGVRICPCERDFSRTVFPSSLATRYYGDVQEPTFPRPHLALGSVVWAVAYRTAFCGGTTVGCRCDTVCSLPIGNRMGLASSAG